MSNGPSPFALWSKAADEHPHDVDARRSRYQELMREHGLIIDREPGDDSPILPCMEE